MALPFLGYTHGLIDIRSGQIAVFGAQCPMAYFFEECQKILKNFLVWHFPFMTSELCLLKRSATCSLLRETTSSIATSVNARYFSITQTNSLWRCSFPRRIKRCS